MSGETPEFEHAWRHFQLHAAQRVSVFNFFVASAGLLLSGLAYVLQIPGAPWTLGILAGLLLAALSFLFWKLDQRAGDLIKRAEDSLIEFEKGRLAAPHQLFAGDAALRDVRRKWSLDGVWTYGRSFRLLFWTLGLLGLAGSGVVLKRHFSAAAVVEKASQTRAEAPLARQTQRATPSTPGVACIKLPSTHSTAKCAVAPAPTKRAADAIEPQVVPPNLGAPASAELGPKTK